MTSSNPGSHPRQPPTYPIEASLKPSHNDAGCDLETLIAERAAQRTADWAQRQTTRHTLRQQHQQARNHGLQARHNRKLARQEIKP